MRFIDSNSNWKTYMSSDKNMVLLPQIVFSELCGLIRKAVNGPNQLKNVLNQFAEIIPCAPTQNYSWGFLEQDINNFVKALQVKVNKGKFPVFMDCLAVLIKVGNLSPQDINEYLEDNKIRYQAEFDNRHSVIWKPIEESMVFNKMTEVQQVIFSVSQQANEEIRRARKSLEDAGDERAIKDALRSCVSAMEAVVKELGQDDEIGKATKNLRNEQIWGADCIVKEGLSIFNNMHKMYPDLRHGSTESSSLTLNEAEYWIGRILNYIQYMDKQQKIIKQHKSEYIF